MVFKVMKNNVSVYVDRRKNIMMVFIELYYVLGIFTYIKPS